MEQGIIYLRTSTKEQNPLKDKKRCLELAAAKNIQIAAEDIFIEKKSAFKEGVIRDEWIKAHAKAIAEKKHIIVPRYDRTWRNEKEFVKFMREMYLIHKLKVYSDSESYLNEIWNVTNTLDKIPPPFDILINNIMTSLFIVLVTMTGQKAEEESLKKSKSVKSAVKKRDGKITRSYKGNRWGRKPIPKQTKDKVIKFHLEGFSYRKISSMVNIYDKNRNPKPIPKSTVSDIINEYKSMSENT